jgi:osmoprotectant transport system ATP-binding protein
VANVGLDLVLTGVRKRYGNTWVVDGASFVVSAGRCTALLGPSGCGKSTLLRLILGLLQADAGSIQFGDRDAVSSDLRGRTGYVIQDGGLFPHLNAAENLALKARDLGWPSARIADRIREVAAISHFPADLLGHYPLQLSGGQRQRVGLMRALMLDPDLLLLDEPLAALDPVVRAELQDELRSIFRTLGKTVLFVTHDLAEAAFLADEIVLLRSGRVVQSGPWRDLVERPADDFARQFVRAQRALHLMDGAPS